LHFYSVHDLIFISDLSDHLQMLSAGDCHPHCTTGIRASHALGTLLGSKRRFCTQSLAEKWGDQWFGWSTRVSDDR